LLAGQTDGPAAAQHQGIAVTIAIVDYGVGNLASVKKSLDRIGVESVVTSDPDRVASSKRIVLPGVGHFAATSSLKKAGLQDAIQRSIKRGVPFLGICVGMQWMLDSSEESPETQGLGIWPGVCVHFPSSVKSPHVGWNQLELRDDSSSLLRNIPSGAYVYFTHSYRVPLLAATTAESEYGGKFSAVVEQENVFGVQFHPEKSGAAGLKLLQNFCSL
jgi:imidazole glycerol-phosphate synthase subunit HisH